MAGSIPLLRAHGGSFEAYSTQSLQATHKELQALRQKASVNKVAIKILDACCLPATCSLHLICFCCCCDLTKMSNAFYKDPNKNVRFYPSDCTACECRRCWDPRFPPSSRYNLWCRRDVCVLCFCCAKEETVHYLTPNDRRKYLRLQQVMLQLLANPPPPPPQQMGSSELQSEHINSPEFSAFPPDFQLNGGNSGYPPTILDIIFDYADNGLSSSKAPNPDEFEYVRLPSSSSSEPHADIIGI